MNKIDKTILQMKLAIITDYLWKWKIPCPRITVMSEVIKEKFPKYRIDLDTASDTKERWSAGCRYVTSRKTYEWWKHIKVRNEKWEKILDHNPQETYRYNWEVATKILWWLGWKEYSSPERKEFDKARELEQSSGIKKQKEFIEKYKKILSSN